MLRKLNVDYNGLLKKGILTPVVEAKCSYFHPARYDDIVIIETRITKVSEKSIRFEYRALRKKDRRLLASGHTVNVFVDGEKMKSVKIPADTKKKLKVNT